MPRITLTAGEEKFIEEYILAPDNATRAYRRAYPKATVEAARVGAARMLAKANVRKIVARRRADLARKMGVRQERAIEELKRIAFSDMGDVFDFEDMAIRRDIDPLARKTIQEIVPVPHGVKIKLKDATGALDKLMRHMGLYKDLQSQSKEEDFDLSKVTDAQLKKIRDILTHTEADRPGVSPEDDAGGLE